MVIAAPIPRKELNLYPIDYPFETLVSKIDHNTLILDPDFQRKYKWDNAKASRLIESCLMQVPLPSCYFAEDQNKNHLVIDGVQRIKSVHRFIKNEFPLKDLQTYKELNGKYFGDLELRIRRHIETYTIRCIILRNDNDPVLIRDIFARVNQGSVLLSPQEIRHALYPGDFNKLLDRLSEQSEIQELTTGDTKKNDRTAQEIVLRFFALNNDLKDYDSKLKEFLDDYMMKHQYLSEDKVNEMRSNFEDCLKKCRDVFLQYVFADPTKQRIRRSIAHYDLQMYSLQFYSRESLIQNREKIVEAYKELCLESEFQKTLAGRITQKSSILNRREMWLKRLNDIN
jgi:hypothetical protein